MTINQIILLSLHLKKHQNSQGDMIYEYSIDGATLRQCIEAMPPSTINFTIPESAMEAWQDDYANMRRFFIYGESLEFDELMQRIEELQKRVSHL